MTLQRKEINYTDQQLAQSVVIQVYVGKDRAGVVDACGCDDPDCYVEHQLQHLVANLVSDAYGFEVEVGKLHQIYDTGMFSIHLPEPGEVVLYLENLPFPSPDQMLLIGDRLASFYAAKKVTFGGPFRQ